MLTDHREAITAQAAEVERLEHETAQLDARAALIDAHKDWERLVRKRQSAAVELVETARDKLRHVVELDAQLQALAQTLRTVAGDAGVPVPAVRPPHRLTAAAEAPGPILEALDTALATERQVRKNEQRRAAQKEQVAA
jgi:hypothetical protein